MLHLLRKKVLLYVAVPSVSFGTSAATKNAKPPSKTSHLSKQRTGKDSRKQRGEDQSLLPSVVLIGRPNVGKSALFNRLVRRKEALIYDTPGGHVTRDYREGIAQLSDLRFKLFDTAGMEADVDDRSLLGRAMGLTAKLLLRCHLALFMLDARAGVQPMDLELARWLHRTNRLPVVLAANKCEGGHRQADYVLAAMGEAYQVGYGEAVAISAESGEGLADLYEKLQPHIDRATADIHAEHLRRNEKVVAAAARPPLLAPASSVPLESSQSADDVSRLAPGSGDARNIARDFARDNARDHVRAQLGSVSTEEQGLGGKRVLDGRGVDVRLRESMLGELRLRTGWVLEGLESPPSGKSGSEKRTVAETERGVETGAETEWLGDAAPPVGRGVEAAENATVSLAGITDADTFDDESKHPIDHARSSKTSLHSLHSLTQEKLLQQGQNKVPPSVEEASEIRDREEGAGKMSREEGERGIYGAFSERQLAEVQQREKQLEEAAAVPLQFAIAGRPNVGKSTLVNYLLGQDRVLTGPEPGLTRDSVRIPFEHGGRPIWLVDTAGWMHRSKLEVGGPQLSAADARKNIMRAHVVALVLDAEEITSSGVLMKGNEITLASWVLEEGRALIVLVNKIDCLFVPDQRKLTKKLEAELNELLPQARGAPILTLSALNGQGASQLMPKVVSLYDSWKTRLSTARLNRWLQKVETKLPNKPGYGVRVRYITQVKARPPTFVVFISGAGDFPASRLRFLASGIRKEFGMDGVPIRMQEKRVERKGSQGASQRKR